MSIPATTAVVVDTMVVGWLFEGRPNDLAERYRSLIGPARVLLAFQTVMELRYGALRAGWGDFRRRRLERTIGQFTVAQPDDAMISLCARLRADCLQAGHGLQAKVHDGDRWIASTAIRLGVPLVSHDAIFQDAPGLSLITADPQ